LRRPRDTLYPQKLALTSPTSGGRSVGVVRLRTKATEFVSFMVKIRNKTLADGVCFEFVNRVKTETITIISSCNKSKIKNYTKEEGITNFHLLTCMKQNNIGRRKRQRLTDKSFALFK
jgi:hypothetical protein